MANQKELEELIEHMNNMQLSQYITALTTVFIPQFSDEFIRTKKWNQYLNAIFVSFGFTCTIIFDTTAADTILNLAHTHVHARTRIFTSNLDLVRNLDLDFARTFDIDLALNLAQSYIQACTLANIHTRDRDRDIARSRILALAYDLIRARDLVCACELAKVIKANRTLAIFPLLSRASDNALKHFLELLRRTGGEYWATYYEMLLQNNLVPTVEQKEDLFAIPQGMYKETLEVTSLYLLSRHEEKIVFNETRLILLGNKGAGKTTFARRFQNLDAQMPKNYESTKGVDFYTTSAAIVSHNYEGKSININIWDFAGHEVTHSAHKFFLSNEAVYVIICDGRTEDGGQKTVSDWLEHITYFAHIKEGRKIPVFMVTNQKDDHYTEIIYDSIYDDKYDIQEYSINLKKDNKKNGQLDKLRQEILARIEHVQRDRELVPASLVKIREDLYRSNLDSYMTVCKAKRIIEKYFKGDYLIMLSFLHIFGICFFYGDKVTKNADVVVMNPRWTTNAIYSIINYIKKERRSDGSIKYDELTTALNSNGDQYPREVCQLIVSMATNFELAYEKDNTLIFPCCISENFPKGKKHLQTQSKDIQINLETRSNGILSPPTIPTDIISNLICKCHRNLNYCSRKAMVLKELGINEKVNAEVVRVRADRISILVEGHDEDSCEVSEILTRLTQEVIRNYERFQREPPRISLTYTNEKMNEITEWVDDILGETWSDLFIPLPQQKNWIQKALEKTELKMQAKAKFPGGVSAEISVTKPTGA
ncbi:MAG: COR domain-containing protein [Lachnospiraceae bacterium]